MQYSKYTFKYPVADGVVALYHSLLVRTVFISSHEENMLSRYFSTDELDGTDDSKSVLEYLYKNFFIVDSDSDDSELYSKCIDLIPESAISNVYLVVTENCNFDCKYCFISNAIQDKRASKTMSESVARKSARLLQKTYERQQHSYDKTITFYGGEPLLNIPAINAFFDEIKQIKQEGVYWPSDIKFALISNGSLLSPEIIEFLLENKVALSISFDLFESSHSQRIDKSGRNSYDIVLEKIRLCNRLSFPYSLSITITKEFLRNKNKVTSIINELAPATIAYNLLIPNSKTVQDDAYYDEATQFMIDSFCELRNQGMYEDRIMRKVHSFKENKMHLYDCCAGGGNQYTITFDGKIGICHGYLNNRKYFTATIFDDKFDFRENDSFKIWKNRTPLLMQECQACECLSICGGGCPYAAEKMYGSIYDMDTRFCIHAKKILRWLIIDLYNQLSQG